MKIISLKDVPKQEVKMAGAEKATVQRPISSADSTPTVSFRVFTLAPGGYTPYHAHDFEHVNYVISGRGAIKKADGSEHPLVAGDFALVLPNEKHQYRNTGTEDFIMICAVPKEYE